MEDYDEDYDEDQQNLQPQVQKQERFKDVVVDLPSLAQKINDAHGALDLTGSILSAANLEVLAPYLATLKVLASPMYASTFSKIPFQENPDVTSLLLGDNWIGPSGKLVNGHTNQYPNIPAPHNHAYSCIIPAPSILSLRLLSVLTPPRGRIAGIGFLCPLFTPNALRALTASGAAALFDALDCDAHLVHLCLDSNGIGDAGAAHVADFVDAANVATLELFKNEIRWGVGGMPFMGIWGALRGSGRVGAISRRARFDSRLCCRCRFRSTHPSLSTTHRHWHPLAQVGGFDLDIDRHA